MPKKEFKLDKRQKSRLQELMERELAITRGMLFNQLQEWKRRIYEQTTDLELNVGGKAWEGMNLTDGDIKFINAELVKFVNWEYPDEILVSYAKSLYEKLSAVAKPTFNQTSLKEDLESALTIDGQPFA